MYQDPAYDPNRTVLGSPALGSLATASDNGITEISKLGNGIGNSLATIFGADKVAQHFQNNVDIMQHFQDKSSEANPKAAEAGKWTGIGTAALLTTPAFGMKMGQSIATGVAGGLSSALADAGSNYTPPTSDDLSFAGKLGVGSGILGGALANGIVRGGMHFGQSLIHPASQLARVPESAIEGYDPRRLLENK